MLEGRPGQKAMIVGQAPGVVEAEEGRPWRGRAGQTLRRWLELDEEQFYGLFYCVSVTRCYPGRYPSGRGDRPATPRELDLCRFWLEWELRLLDPRVIALVGGLAVKRLLGISRLDDCVGARFELGDAVAVPLPHPSGASGWLNSPANRSRLADALDILREELARAGVLADSDVPPG